MMKKRQGCLDYNSAYTLIEVMLVLAIVSVVLISAQRPLLEFRNRFCCSYFGTTAFT